MRESNSSRARARRRVGFLGTALVLVAATGSWQFATAAESDSADRSLTRDLNQLLNSPEFADGQASVLVSDAEGDVLYEHGSDERLMPASTTKLFTSAAALHVLGPDHRFETRVLADATPSDGTVSGDLYLEGGGDPTTLASDYRNLAEQVAEAGVRTVHGDLVADDDWFDDERSNSWWTIGSESDYYAAQVSALTVAPDDDYDSGTVRLDIAPGARPGERPELTLRPRTSYVDIVNQARTGDPDGDSTISVEREHGTNRIVVQGTVPADADAFSKWVPVDEPTGYAADVFARALRQEGIELAGDVTTGNTPRDVERLAVHRSMPLEDLLVPFLKLSNNLHAEHLVKQLGQEEHGEGSWDAGLRAVGDAVADLGVETDRISLQDGSGLGRASIVSSRQIVNLLQGVRDQHWFESWHRALPIAGAPDRLVGGTLSGRMVDTAAENNLHGKTGSLTGVSALAGYVTTADDERLTFSVIHNNHQGADAKALEDALAVRLAEHSADADEQPTVRLRDLESDGPAAELECSWVKAC